MLEQVFWFFVFAVPVFFLGALASWRAIERRERAARAVLERSMTARVQERYEAYVELEAQIRRAIEQFDRCEAEFREQLETHGAHIGELEGAMLQHAGEAMAPRPVARVAEEATDFLGLSDWTPSGQETPAPGPSAQVSEWESRVASLQDEKRVAIERQSSIIAELTERLARLEPLSDSLRRLEQELAESKKKCLALEERGGDGAATLRQRVEDADRQLADAARRERELHRRCVELEGVSQTTLGETRWRGEVSLLQGRVGELAPYVERANESERRARDWEARCEEVERVRRADVAERERRIAELASKMELAAETEQRVAEWSARYADMEARKDLEIRTVESRARDLEAASAAMERQVVELERAQDELRTSMGASQIELENVRTGLRARDQELHVLAQSLAAKDRSLAELERSESELRVSVTARQTELENVRTELTARENALRELERMLAARDERTSELERSQEVLRASMMACQVELDEARAELTVREAELHELEQVRLEKDGRIFELERSQVEAHASTAARKAELDEARAELTAREAELRQLEQARAGRDERIVELESSQEELRASMSAREAELESLRSELAVRDTELRELGRALSELAREKAAQAGLLRERDESVAQLGGRANALEDELRRVRASSEGQSTRISELMKAVDVAQEDANTLKVAATENASVVESAESILAEVRPKIEALERELGRRRRS